MRRTSCWVGWEIIYAIALNVQEIEKISPSPGCSYGMNRLAPRVFVLSVTVFGSNRNNPNLHKVYRWLRTGRFYWSSRHPAFSGIRPHGPVVIDCLIVDLHLIIITSCKPDVDIG